MGEPTNIGVGTMSLAIVLLGWVAASIVLSPVLGRFMSAQDEGEGRTGPRQVPARSPAAARLQYGVHTTVRRNVAIQMPRRGAGWPRIG
jgi:hypothetical protein